MAVATRTTARDVAGELAFLTRALKAPTLREAVPRLAEQARAESWSHEEFLAACLQREVSARESHGGEGRIRAARFPARKALEDFDYDYQRSLKRETIAHLGTLDFVAARDNVVFLGPPGTGKTMLAIGRKRREEEPGVPVQLLLREIRELGYPGQLQPPRPLPQPGPCRRQATSPVASQGHPDPADQAG
jgi:hypothetical protein